MHIISDKNYTMADAFDEIPPALHDAFKAKFPQGARGSEIVTFYNGEIAKAERAAQLGWFGEATDSIKLENQRAAIEIEVRGSFEEKIQAEIDKQFTALLKGQNNDFTERKNPDKRKR